MAVAVQTKTLSTLDLHRLDARGWERSNFPQALRAAARDGGGFRT
ncbi:MAG: hypothetical protein WAN05_23535 [Roseiarcus sp.]